MWSGHLVGSGEMLEGWAASGSQVRACTLGGHLLPPNWSGMSHLYVEKVKDLKPPTRI